MIVTSSSKKSGITTTELSRIAPIDGIRGIAILMVVCGHLFFDPFEKEILKLSPILSNITKCYPWGVHLFFVVSGFLIGGILIRNKRSFCFIKSFYMRRIIRIWPLYYFLIIFVVGGLYYVGNKQVPADKMTPFWPYLVFLQNYWKHTQYYHLIEAGVTWSLAIEEQFYLLAPLFLIGASFKKIKYFVLGSMLISFLLRIIENLHIGIRIPVFHHVFNLSYQDPAFFVYIDMILIGVLGAALTNSHAAISFLKKKKTTHFTLPIIGFIIYLAAIKHTNILFLSCYPDIIALLFISVILLVVTNPEMFIARALSNNVLRNIGKGCYFIYLFHIVVMVNIQQTFEDLAWHNLFLANLASVLLTLIAAVLSWKLLEAPLSNWSRKKWPYMIDATSKAAIVKMPIGIPPVTRNTDAPIEI